ncbi:MAG: spermidine synthase [Burkholderiales bacterium]|jgi:protein-L-isoaspartate O-methyltransferase
MLPYALTIFLSAFLLFLVQPLIAKQILPWFGGSASVWNTCMLFFQTLLLAGYAYADRSVQHLNAKRQVILHAVLLVLSLLCLPIIASESWKPQGDEDPIIRILGLLVATIGLPYALLSTTTPLIQAWYWQSFKQAVPYRLFALSNAASLAALLGYPTLIEPFFGGRQTALVWSVGYAIFALLCIWVGWKSISAPASLSSTVEGRSLAPQSHEDESAAGKTQQGSTQSPPLSARLAWIVLSALGSAVLLAVTNHLTQNISSVPFLWVLPLALYLITFIICFDRPGWYHRGFWGVAAAISLPVMVYFADSLALFQVSGLYAAGLFAVCMFCHGELASLKPHPSQLTRFYLAMSLGGALGALSIAIGAPMLLSGYYELHITLAVIALVLLWRSFDSTWIWRFSSAGLVAAVLFLVHDGLEAYRLGIREMERNFYGVVRTRDYPSEPGFRYMLHGAINHGGQLQGEPFEMMPATYYSPNSGYGRLFQAMPEGPKRVGLIGLGAGALAAYAQSGDQWVIYEINPAVVDLAKKEFSFLDRMKAPYEIVLGDGRLALEREAPRQYDVLAVDAFSGDSIPIHLVTKEAMAAYVKHLAPGGVIVFQATNRFVDLPPVAKRLADAFGLEAVLVEDSPQFTTGPERWYLHTDQIIMTKNKDVLKHPAFKEAKPISLRPDVGVFTDDHSNLLRILKH